VRGFSFFQPNIVIKRYFRHELVKPMDHLINNRVMDVLRTAVWAIKNGLIALIGVFDNPLPIAVPALECG